VLQLRREQLARLYAAERLAHAQELEAMGLALNPMHHTC
jgi:hypothetical protein